MDEIRWPRYQDGAEVRVGDMAMSVAGPMRVVGVEWCGDGRWNIRGRKEPVHCHDGEEPEVGYVIDSCEGEDPRVTRADEWCEFWPEGACATIEYYGADVVARSTHRSVADVWAEAAEHAADGFATTPVEARVIRWAHGMGLPSHA